MKNEMAANNTGKNWRSVQTCIGHMSNELHIGYDTLYAYLFQAAHAYVQKRVVAGCNIVMVVAQFGDYDTADNTLQAGRGVMCWMVVYTDGNTPSPHSVCLYSHTGKDTGSAKDYFDSIVGILQAEVEV